MSTSGRPGVPGDRRDAVARYVQFADEATQERFIEQAEDVFVRASGLHPWSGAVSLEVTPPTTVSERRGVFRKAREVTTPGETLVLSATLAEAGRTAMTLPAKMRDLGGCEAGSQVAVAMGGVILHLLRDLAELSVEEERDHPASRQALRLAAELQTLYDVTADVGCLDHSGCVGLRSPERWGRRLDDVEVDEVRAVLVQLSEQLH